MVRGQSRKQVGTSSPIGLYLHIPFCAAICNYCNFNRGLHDDDLRRRYVDALVADIRRSAEPAVAADTIFFGGGTPSLLEPAEVARLITACRESFDLAPGSEITLEANPESATAAALDGYRAAGVNRLSFGVQSFRDEELKRLGRLHSAAGARDAVRRARQAGFDNLSLDLMLWLPGQRPADWLESVEGLIDAGPDHASLYLLEIYPNAPIKDEMARSGWSVAPDDDAAEMYLEGLARLDRAGFEQYEISNVAGHHPMTQVRVRAGRRAALVTTLSTGRKGSGLASAAAPIRPTGGERWRTISSTTDYVGRIACRGRGHRRPPRAGGRGTTGRSAVHGPSAGGGSRPGIPAAATFR